MKISGSNFAKLTGCSRQNIYKLVRENKLVKALDNKYDLNDPTNLDYILKHGKSPDDIKNFLKNIKSNVGTQSEKIKVDKKKTITRSVPSPKKELKKSNDQAKIQIDLNKKIKNINNITPEYFEAILKLPEKCMKMTMEELVFYHGNIPGIDKYTKYLSQLMTAMEKSLKNKEKNNELIPKKYIKSTFFTYLSELNKQLFNIPESWMDYLIAIIKSDENMARIKGLDRMKKDISKMIQETQKKVISESNKTLYFEDDTNA